MRFGSPVGIRPGAPTSQAKNCFSGKPCNAACQILADRGDGAPPKEPGSALVSPPEWPVTGWLVRARRSRV